MNRSYCEVCKVPLKQRQMDASSSFVNVNSLPEEELDIAIRNQELLVPLRMQVSEYAKALVGSNNRPKAPTTNFSNTFLRDASHLDLLIKSHEESLREKYQRLEQLKQQRTLQRLQNHQLTTKNDLLVHLKEQTALHLAVLEAKRIHMALRVFKMIPILLLAPSQRGKEASDHKNVFGCSSILGISLQNNGYFEESPIEQLSAAVSHIAELTVAVATVFNITLPHPIHANALEGPTIAPQYAENAPHLLLPATSISLREQYRSFEWTTLNQLRQRSYNENQKRSQHEHNNSNELVINPTFYQSLTLLQANIVTLCLKLGMNASELWPAPCMLLNLYELHQYCRRKQTASSSSPSAAAVSGKNGVANGHARVIDELRQRMEKSAATDYYKASVEDVNKRLAHRFARDFSLVYRKVVGVTAEGGDADGEFLTVDHHIERREVSADGEWDLL